VCFEMEKSWLWRGYLWPGNDELRFVNELGCLMRMRAKQHKNIVRFLGYHWYEDRVVCVTHNNIMVVLSVSNYFFVDWNS
jgi:hypothetical protein